MNKKILGLDIRHDSVSAVLLSSSMKEARIEAGAYSSISGNNDLEKGLKQCFESIRDKTDISGSVCAVSLPSDQLSYRNIQLPFKQHKKIRQILPFELESTLPFSSKDLCINFQAIKLPGNTGHTDILAAAIEKSRLESYLKLFSSFKIDPAIVTIGGYNSALCLVNLGDVPQNCLFIDLDKRKATVSIVVSRQVSLIRPLTISHGGSSITQSLCSGIKHTLYAFENIFSNDFQPEAVMITGYDPINSDLEKDMERLLGLPVKQAEMIHETGIVNNQTDGSWNTGQMDNALASALIEIERINVLNLRSGSFSAKKNWVKYKKQLAITGLLTGALMALLFLNIFFGFYTNNKKLHQLDQQITDIFRSTFPDVKKIVAPLHQMQIKIKEMEKYSALPGEDENHILIIDILNGISKLIPKKTEIEFNRIVIAPDTIQISGNADTFNSVDEMKSRLEKASFIKKVTISSANMDKSGNNVRFKLKAHL